LKKAEIQQERVNYLKQVKNEVKIANSQERKSEGSKEEIEYINMSPEPLEKKEKSANTEGR
jgi:hypothetical protein